MRTRLGNSINRLRAGIRNIGSSVAGGLRRAAGRAGGRASNT